MANQRLDTGGSGDHTTFAAALAALSSPDDVIYIKSTSAENPASSQSYVNAIGTPAQPTRVISVNDFTSYTPTPGGGWDVTNSIFISLTGYFKFHGIKHNYTGTSNIPGLDLGNTGGNAIIEMDGCAIGTSSSSTSTLSHPVDLGPSVGGGSSDNYKTILKNTTINFGHINNAISIGIGNHALENISLSGSVPNKLFTASVSTGLSNAYLSSSDLSSVAIGAILDGGSTGQTKVFLNDVKLNAATAFFSGTMSAFNEITAVNCAVGDTSIQYYYANYAGTVLTDSTVHATTNPLPDSGISVSRKMTTTATAGRGFPLKTELLLPVANDATITPYVELLVGEDGAAALKTTECWIDVEAITTDGTTLGTIYTTHPGMFDAGTTDCAVGTTTYDNDGFATERTHRIELSSAITVRQDSLIKITVNLAKPSTIVYVGSYGG